MIPAVALAALVGLAVGSAHAHGVAPASNIDIGLTVQDPLFVLPEVDIYEGTKSSHLEIAAHPFFSEHRLRFAEPKLCDDVQQYSGYLDISDTRHLFFWFFEARHDPENAPLMLWLNGGPGASSLSAGLLFENGPCTISSDGDVVRNPFSWNEHANTIYLDQPIWTGYSYASDDSTVTNLKDDAKDVYAFLQVFLRRFPQYGSAPFHIAAESWGGHYGPNIGHLIYEQNERMQHDPFPGQVEVHLASLILANGLTDPLTQFESIPDYMCGGGAPYPPHAPDSLECIALRLSQPPCVEAIKACYAMPNSAKLCRNAGTYCWNTQLGIPMLGKNPYDLRLGCSEEEAENLCYPQVGPIVKWLDRNDTKVALGVDPSRKFAPANYTVNAAFYHEGQAMLNSAALLPVLVDNGVRLMAFAGDVDGLCNYIGVGRWMARLNHTLHAEFQAAPTLPWATWNTRYHAGTVRSAGPGAGNVTFIRVFEAGHMAPHDQPEATLDMITRWLDNVSLA